MSEKQETDIKHDFIPAKAIKRDRMGYIAVYVFRTLLALT